METNPRLSLVIPARNEQSLLPALLDTVHRPGVCSLPAVHVTLESFELLLEIELQFIAVNTHDQPGVQWGAVGVQFVLNAEIPV